MEAKRAAEDVVAVAAAAATRAPERVATMVAGVVATRAPVEQLEAVAERAVTKVVVRETTRSC